MEWSNDILLKERKLIYSLLLYQSSFLSYTCLLFWTLDITDKVFKNMMMCESPWHTKNLMNRYDDT